jgi:inner membrane protein
MASVGHVMFGISIGASLGHTKREWLVYPALAMLPDADVVAFAFGIPYASEFGPRGASHAIVTGLVVGALVGYAFMRTKRGALLGALAMVSHGLFDALTTGGEGIALLWPFTDERFFAPWRPIPVAPIGLGFFSARGLYCVAVELALFAPFVVLALVVRRLRRLRRA